MHSRYQELFAKGALLAHQGALSEATTILQEALREQSPSPAARLHLLAKIAINQGQFAEAAHYCQAALQALGPTHHAATLALLWADLGKSHVGAKAYEDAIAAYQTAQTLDGTSDAIEALLGDAYGLQANWQAALTHYLAAHERAPHVVQHVFDCGLCAQHLHQNEATKAFYQKALVLDPQHLLSLKNLAVLHYESDDPNVVLNLYARVLELTPDDSQVHYNVGVVHLEQKNLEAAGHAFEQAIAADCSHALAHVNLGHTLIKRDPSDRNAGWAEIEWRWQLKELLGAARSPEKLWLGQSDAVGKTILLWAEQGYGDTLQFSRYVPWVKDLLQGCDVTLILQVPPRLERLMRTLEGVDVLVSEDAPTPAHDFHTPLMSLPLVCQRLTLRQGVALQWPHQRPYLGTTTGLSSGLLSMIDAVREHAQQQRLCVGLVWAGGHRPDNAGAHRIDQVRSMPLKNFVPLSTLQAVQFFSLQKDKPAEQLQDIVHHGWAGAPIVDAAQVLHDWADTAALAQALDLVISVDSAVAHLMGAMGKPVWMLNRYNGCWRWGMDREETFWYPSMRIFNQPRRGDWPQVIAQVRDALEHEMASSAADTAS